MARLNRAEDHNQTTHEGAKAKRILPIQELRRSVLSCLLWEDSFYESGVSIAERIYDLALKCNPEDVAALAMEARTNYNLRHAPLILIDALTKTGARSPGFVSSVIYNVIQRPDELAELLAVYWRNGRKPLSGQLKKGLARAFTKFDEYSLAKYNNLDNKIKLRDVLFLSHARPLNPSQKELFSKLVNNTLKTPDTWEVALSAGGDKKETFERLIREGKLGYLALLRNLRNMEQAGCDRALVNEAIRARRNGADRVLPFRFVSAARAAPSYERALDDALLANIEKSADKFYGRTIVLVDVSGSMEAPLSGKSDLSRLDAAATLASVIPGDVSVFTFSDKCISVPARLGMAGVDSIRKSQPHCSTFLGKAVTHVNNIPHDRLIVITDEQSQDRVPDPVAKYAYMINVASYKNGVGYGRWVHLDGFSERVLSWIAEYERG